LIYGNNQPICVIDPCRQIFLFQNVVYTNLYNSKQGRHEIRWRPGQEASLAPPCSNPRSFGSKCAVLKKVHVTF